MLGAALAGGVDMVQLRDKRASDEELLEAAALFRSLCDEHGALFWLNDRPDLALRAGADGVHVGQDDQRGGRRCASRWAPTCSWASPRTRRSSSSARSAPRWTRSAWDPCTRRPRRRGARPPGSSTCATRPPRPASGPGSRSAASTWTTSDAVAEAGARRLAVVRVLRDAPDPAAVAAALRSRLEPWPSMAESRSSRKRRKARPAGTRRGAATPDVARRSSAATRARAGATRRHVRRSCRSAPGERPGAVTLAVAVAAVLARGEPRGGDRELRPRRGRQDREQPARRR